jgi:hypothetical protein
MRLPPDGPGGLSSFRSRDGVDLFFANTFVQTRTATGRQAKIDLIGSRSNPNSLFDLVQ